MGALSGIRHDNDLLGRLFGQRWAQSLINLACLYPHPSIVPRLNELLM